MPHWARCEIRRLRISSQLNDYLAPKWPNVAQVFQIERIVTRNGKTSTQLAYGFTSLPAAIASPDAILQFV